MSLLDKLIEKKDLMTYMDNRIEHLKQKMDSVIKNEPEKNRVKIRGRIDELSELKAVVHDNNLKQMSKNYFRSNKKEKLKLDRDWQKDEEVEIKELLPMGCGEGKDYMSCSDCACDYDTEKCKKERKLNGKYVVRLYDGFDNKWIDVSEPVSKVEAEKILAKKTNNGTKNTSFTDIDYYCIFNATTRMLNRWKDMDED